MRARCDIHCTGLKPCPSPGRRDPAGSPRPVGVGVRSAPVAEAAERALDEPPAAKLLAGLSRRRIKGGKQQREAIADDQRMPLVACVAPGHERKPHRWPAPPTRLLVRML